MREGLFNPGDEISAENIVALNQALKKIDICVPPQGKNRTTSHREQYTICKFVASLAANSLVQFPIKITKRERPDFVLRVGAKSIGIEVTELVNPDYARAMALKVPNQSLFTDASLFKLDAPNQSNEQLIAALKQSKLTGPGWQGSSAEWEYAKAVASTIAKKAASLGKPGYQRYTEDWLLVYNNLMLPCVDEKEAATHLRSIAAEYWKPKTFSQVAVITDNDLMIYTTKEDLFYPTTNLWS